MKTLIWVNSFIFSFSAFSILLVFTFTPILILIVYAMLGRRIPRCSPIRPSVSLITIVHNAANLIENKLNNSLSLIYPSGDYEIVIFSDGSTDDTEDRIRSFVNERIRFVSSPTHEGKNSAINKAVMSSKGEIIVFSDADAMLDRDAIINLVRCFADPKVGGVCGNNFIYEESKFGKVQRYFIQFDRFIKRLESDVGNVSANTGKLSAIRRDLFQPLPQDVVDDLYISLSIIKQYYRFIFEPNAKAHIRALSRDPTHEIRRRRRVVTRALTCIFTMKELLNPMKYGFFSMSLLINKVFRTFLPIFMLLIFCSSLFLSFYSLSIKIILYMQIAFYLSALSYWVGFQYAKNLEILKKITSIVFYFCLGNYGTLLGILDFMKGKRITKWEPLKSD